MITQECSRSPKRVRLKKECYGYMTGFIGNIITNISEVVTSDGTKWIPVMFSDNRPEWMREIDLEFEQSTWVSR